MADDESDSDSTLADVPWFARGSKASQRPPKGQPGELLFEFDVTRGAYPKSCRVPFPFASGRFLRSLILSAAAATACSDNAVRPTSISPITLVCPSKRSVVSDRWLPFPVAFMSRPRPGAAWSHDHVRAAERRQLPGRHDASDLHRGRRDAAHRLLQFHRDGDHAATDLGDTLRRLRR